MKKLLIEQISTIEVPKQSLIESINNNDGRLIIKNVLLQRADTPNKNKRVYGRSVLNHALNEYFTKIKEKRAFSELDHPNCFWTNTEILTKDGWKYIKDINVGEQVATLNTNNRNMEWQPVNSVVNQQYTGKMIRLVGTNINTCVTPNHRFYIVDRNDKLSVITAQELYDTQFVKKSIHAYIPISAGWEGEHVEEWVLDGNLDYHGTHVNREKQKNPLVLNAEAFFAFLGFYLAEGCVTIRDQGGFSINISQNEGDRAVQFRDVLSKLSPEITWSEDLRTNKKNIIFTITDSRLHKYLEPLGNKYTKFIPDEIKNASVPLLKILFNWFLKGDGANVNGRRSVFTVSRDLIEDLHEILLKIGYAGVIKIQNNHEKDRFIEGRLIEGKNCKPLNRLWVKTSKGIYLDFRFLKVEEIEYDGTVHCVNVDNKTIYCKDGISPFWSGNSEDLANVVSLKNVCQAIQDAYWKGNELRGDVEVLNTPSGKIVKEILLAGYRVGQSSRGLGSVKPLHEGEDDEIVEVQNDFEFLTLADCVSDPSTHNADMILGENYKPPHQENNVDTLLQEILCSMSGICCFK